MPFHLEVPLTVDGPLNFSVDVGQTVFVLGANGTGKSSLMHRFFSIDAGSARNRRTGKHGLRRTLLSHNGKAP
jgi:ABC-type lipoprotein export system ATPase subunit